MDLFARLEAAGITRDRLEAALSSNDRWGQLVHSVVYLSVLEAVLTAWKETA